ncbi:hypothetical protein BC940DRAFT_297351 [Gongronella butleri]|nr:hypothetical protein BC940DRAFT_297351 [Gongronella butleri]
MSSDASAKPSADAAAAGPRAEKKKNHYRHRHNKKNTPKPAANGVKSEKSDNKSDSKPKQAPPPKQTTSTSTDDTKDDDDSDDEGDFCFICTEPIVTYAVTPCNHRTCHICALRLRALYKTKNCVYCKTEQKTVIFTKHPTKLFEEFTKKDIHSVDKKLDIQFEDELIHQDTVLSLQFNCPDPECDVACDGWAQLKKHTNKEHNVLLCDLCIKNKKIFAHEHTLYTAVQLNKHYKQGDKALNKDDDSGFKGHPECAFCRMSFYGDDELFTHCRQKHEQCHICVRNGIRHEYYPDYNAMERHFRKDHYLCMYRECLDKKFIVFDTELDLKAHEVEEHGASGRVELNFDYGQHQGASSGRGKGRQRSQQQPPQQQQQQQPSAAPQQAPRNEPVTRPVLASEDFPSISGAAAASTAPRRIPGQPKNRLQGTSAGGSRMKKPSGFGGLTEEQWPDLRQNASGTATSSSPSPSTGRRGSATVPDEAQVQRHASVLDKLSRLLGGPSDVEQFRAVTTAYRNNSIDITGYVNEIIRLCKNDGAKTTTILKDVEELIDNPEKKQEIMRAWRNAQANVENFPALAPLNDRAPVGHGTSKRVLVIKGSNTRVGGTRSTGKSASGVWDRVANAASAANGTQRTSPRGSPSSSRPSSPMLYPTPQIRNKTAWAGTSSSSSTASPAASSSPAAAKSDFPPITQHFPSLPAASRPHTAILKLRQNKAATSAWSPDGARAAADTQEEAPVDTPAANNKKKSKKGKQVLFRVGL